MPDYAWAMQFDLPEVRDAYRKGALDAYESSCVHLDAAQKRAIEQWLVDLAGWTHGDPPVPPSSWAAAEQRNRS